jgi:hypothetical protein
MSLLLVVLKVALIAFVVGGIVALVVRGVMRSRANRADPRWKAYGGPPGYPGSLRGVMPDTPLPEWVHWDDDGDEVTETR